MKVIWSYGKTDFEDAKAIRRKVFIEEQNVKETIEQDEQDKNCYHIVLYEEKQPIGTGRLYKINDYYVLGRVAVLKQFRRKGYGAFLIDEMIKKVILLGGDFIEIHAQSSAVAFYKKLGFKVNGQHYIEADIKHINMVKRMFV